MPQARTSAALALSVALGATQTAGAAEIDVMHGFGDCPAAPLDPAASPQPAPECEVIAALLDRFNETNEGGHRALARASDPGSYDDRLIAELGAGSIPDLAVIRASVLPNFASRDLLAPLGPLLDDAGVDAGDLLHAALANASAEGEIYAVPLDLQTVVLHLNLDLLEQAGLLDAGTPRLPSPAEEFLETGRGFEEATGKDFVAVGSQPTDGTMAHLFLSPLGQQGVEVVADEGRMASIGTPGGLAAASFLKSLYDEGLADPTLDRPRAVPAFLEGRAGLLLAEAAVADRLASLASSGEGGIESYGVAALPRLLGEDDAVRADSHLLVIPADEARPAAEREAALALLGFLHENDAQWSRTGHLPARRSALQATASPDRPHRQPLAAIATAAEALPWTSNWRGVEAALSKGMSTMWLGEADPQAALDAIQADLGRVLGEPG